jgi:hypothetical protein
VGVFRSTMIHLLSEKEYSNNSIMHSFWALYYRFLSPIVVVEWLALLLRILEVPGLNLRLGDRLLNIEHFIESADVEFTVHTAGHSTPWSSSPVNIYLISIRLMLHFLYRITLYLNLGAGLAQVV